MLAPGALYSSPAAQLDVENYFALDTETTRFNSPVYGWKGRTRIQPFGGHTLVLGSIAGAGFVEVYHRGPLLQRIECLLRNGAHLIFHHCAFDIPVLEGAAPALRPLFQQAVDEGRIHDTKILEVLLQIAIGSRTMGNRQLVTSPSLKVLAQKRAGLLLDKEGEERTTFDRYSDPHTPIPRRYLEYAATDALATYLVFRSQRTEAIILSQPVKCKFPLYENAAQKYGLLSENIQIRGALAFAWLEQFPLRVDLEMANRTRDTLEAECKIFEDALILYKWATRGPKTRKFCLKHKLLRGILQTYVQEHNILPEYSDTGLLSLSHDFWSKHIPRVGKDIYAHPEKAATVPERLQVWLRYTRARKLLSTYIYVYASSEHHYPEYQNIGARTGRTACRKPNVQNIPKRRDGIRALFIPKSGYRFIEGDYSAAELAALAQVYHYMYGGSSLERAINAGLDPHIARACQLDPAVSALPLEAQKKHPLRQAAKAVNFGLPGGLGSRTFHKYATTAWGLVLTEDEAVSLRQTALETDPELRRYLEERLSLEERLKVVAHNLCLSYLDLLAYLEGDQSQKGLLTAQANLISWIKGERPFGIPIPPGVDLKFDLSRQTTCTLTGRIRDRATFTESHNTPFQGLVGDAGKCALWELCKLWREDSPWFPSAFIHDSVLIQTKPEHADTSQEILRVAMLRGFAHVCPDIKMTVDFTPPLERWGKNTNPWGEEKENADLPHEPAGGAGQVAGTPSDSPVLATYSQ